MKARPTKCVFGLSVTLSSSSWPIGPSMTSSICACVTKRERWIEDVEIVHDRPQCAHTDARQLQGADLGLLDRLFFDAELHRGVHLDAEPLPGRRLELL